MATALDIAERQVLRSMGKNYLGKCPFCGRRDFAVSEEKNNNYVEVVIDARDDLVEPTLDDAPARLPANGVPATLTIENHRLLSSNHEHPVSLCGKWGKQKGHCNSVQ